MENIYDFDAGTNKINCKIVN